MLKDALRDELEAAEMYKEMLLQIPIQQAYAPLFIAMHDEMEHAIRVSTLQCIVKVFSILVRLTQ